MDDFKITIERFSGPYVKLLEMIEERKLSITEISLSSVADEYITYVKNLENKDYLDISSFVVVAATLMLIKVKSLLPGIAYTETEEKQIHELESKLALHQTLRKAMKIVDSNFGQARLLPHTRSKLDTPLFTPSNSVKVETLHSIAMLMRAAFERVARVKSHVVSAVVRLEDVIDNLRKRISEVTSMKLSELSSNIGTFEENKKSLIVSFLAILELVKVGTLSATQEQDDILLEPIS
jgi:segregation and condensation protein A